MGESMSACCNQQIGPGGLNHEIEITPSDKSSLDIPLGSFRRCQTMKTTDQSIEDTLENALKYRSFSSNQQAFEQLWVMDVKKDNKSEQIFVRGKKLDTEVDGEVKIYFPKGQIFEGNIVNRQPVQGAFVFKKNCFYVGKIQNFNAEGYGRYENNDSGYIYEGNWSRSLPHGNGKQTYRNGDTYEGQIMYGQKFGQGVYHFADGKVYEGSFYYNQSDGMGKMTYANKESYDGEWKLGKFHGKGRFVFQTGEVYQGNYVDGKRQGYGKYTFRDGSYYEGNWENGVQSGKGVFHQGYDRVEGQWANGQLIN